VRKDGSTLWAEVMLSFLWDKDGKLNEVLGVTREITERKKAEEALRESEQRYRLLAENVKDIIWTRDMNLRTTYVSPSVTQISGYSVEEVMSLSIEESLTPASLEIVQSALSKMMAEVKEQKDSSETVVLEVELIHKEGRIVPVEMKVNLLHDSTGRPTGFLGVTRDITERKKAEEALRESEEELQAIFDSSGNGIALLDLEGRVIRVNKRVLEVGGYDLEDISGKPLDLLKMFTPESIERMFSVRDAVLSSHVVTTFECELCTKSGRKMSLEISVGPFLLKGQLFGLVAVMTDITERKRAEEALRQSEERYRLLAENVKDVISVIDMNLSLTYVSPSVNHLLGYSVEEAMALTLEEGLTAASYEKLVRAFAEGMAAEKKGNRSLPMSLVLEVEAKHKDGHLVPIEMMANLLRDAEGKPVGILGVSRDITERKKAEDVLRESEEKLRRYLESSPDAIYINDEKGAFLYGNLVAERVIGYPREELIGKSFLELNIIPPEHLGKAAETLELNMSGKPTGPDEFELIRKDGSRVFVEISTYPMIQGDKIEIIGIARDITERRRMEQELLRLSDAVKMSTDSIVISDLEGNIVDVNEATLKIQGANSKADLIGLKSSDFIAPEEQEKALRDLSKLIEVGHVNDIQYHIATRDGRRVLVETNASIMRGENGEPVGVVAITRDITERKKIEEQLSRLSDAVRMSKDGIAISDLEGRILEANQATIKMHGMKHRTDLIGRGALELIVPEDHEMLTDKMAQALATGSVPNIEYHCIRNDGSKFVVEASISVMKNESGEPTGYMAVARDVTERKLMEEALKENEERFRAVFEGTGLGIALVDMKQNVLGINPAFQRILGYSLEEFRGIRNLEYLHPEDAMADANLYIEMLKGKRDHYTIDKRYIRKDGEIVWGRQNLSVVRDVGGKPVYFIAMIEDITQRKLMEEALRQSEHNYRLLFEGTIDGMFVTDAETMKIVLANQTAAKICGFDSAENTMGINPLDLVHPDDKERVLGFFMEDVSGEGSKEVHEFRAITKDGREIWLSGMGTRIEYGGKPSVLSSIRDSTERKKAEEALRGSEEKFRSVAETASDAIITINGKGNIVLWNQAAETIFGYPAQEVIGKPLAVIMPQRFQDIHEKATKRVVSTGEKKLAGKTIEVSALRKDGSEFPLELAVAVWKSGEEIYSTAIARDISERRKVEQQLHQAGRLAAVGELAAGVAHELNNPLTAIKGFAQFLTARKDLDETIRKDLDTIYRESQRAAKITQNLLSFARKHEPEKHPISINDVIENILEMQDHLMKINNIELEVELAPDLPKTMADFHQMQQVFVNIVNNAEQAMVEANGKGRLLVKTQRSGKMVQITFADNGPGISEENLKRIFDPFFTTKEVGKGTGLGLSICYGLVEAHGGRIYAKSKLGQGATFVVELPIVSEKELVAEAALLKPGSRGVKWKKQKEQY
jgi:PAS domain S-box-containing protein